MQCSLGWECGGAKVGSGAGWFGALHGTQVEITCEKSPRKSWGCFRESVGPTRGSRRAQSPSWPLTLGPDRSRRRPFSPPCLAGVGGWGGRLLWRVPGTRGESWVLCGTTPRAASLVLLSLVVVLSVFPGVGVFLAVPKMKGRRWWRRRVWYTPRQLSWCSWDPWRPRRSSLCLWQVTCFSSPLT